MYSYRTHSVYYTKNSECNHKYGSEHTYIDNKTGNTMAFNNEWNAGGVERCFGFIGWGRHSFINSYRKQSQFKYISFMVRLPLTMEVGFQVGFVSGYGDYKKGLKLNNKLFGVVQNQLGINPNGHLLLRGWKNQNDKSRKRH